MIEEVMSRKYHSPCMSPKLRYRMAKTCTDSRHWLPQYLKLPGLFPSLWTFFENTITPPFRYGIVWILVCYSPTSYLQLLFYTVFQNVEYFLSKNTNLWMKFASFCVVFSSGKKSSFKKSWKRQNLRLLFRFVYFVLKNLKKWSIFGFIWKKKVLITN